MKIEEAVGGVLIFLFGAVTAYCSLRMPVGTFRAAGSGLFPLGLGVLLMGLSAIFIVTSRVRSRRVKENRTPAEIPRSVAQVLLFMAATKPGAAAREILQRGLDAYHEKGFPEEWKFHHQGGSIGYTGRDYRTTFSTQDIVQENQAFTWNPSLRGTKSEDTILAGSKGVEMITQPTSYPTLAVTVDGLSFVRPDILEKDQ